MSWREFLVKFADTAGITLFFAALGSAFMLWATVNNTPTKPITLARALMVLGAGQLVGCCATAALFGFLGWSLFLAPLVGTLCGLVGVFLLLTGLRVGQRLETRGDDLADRGIDIVTRKSGGERNQ